LPARHKRIAILIVAYNAESTLRAVIDRIPPEIMAKVEEIVVFDDASDDRTFEVGEAIQRRHEGPATLTVFRNPVNLMYGGNQRRGFFYCIDRGFDIVVLLHGDGQYAPEVMQRLLDPLENGAADMVFGSRMTIRGGARAGGMPLYKFVGNRILTWTQNRLAGLQLSEFHSGYRAYSVRALATIPLDRLTTNWHFDTQIILEVHRRGYRIMEVPIPTYYGSEICRVQGIPYAVNCIVASLSFALQRLWRADARVQAPSPSRE
jgi:glycosyltransferase involved in cell wall biosynthesis